MRVFLLLLLFASMAEARTLTETQILCEPQLHVYLTNDGASAAIPVLHVETSCYSLDAQGTPLRTFHRDIAGRLPVVQVQALTRILQRIATLNAGPVGIPTPAVTPTDMIVQTPLIEHTP